jgi:2-oxo-3-hexenedioate decarboxylase
MSSATFRAVSEEVVELAASAHTAPSYSSRHQDFNPEMAWRVAERLHQHRLAIGWTPIGRKIGFTNRTIWARYGVDQPMWGHVYDRTVSYAEGDRATVSLEGLAQPRIEPEICFKLKAPPPRSRDPGNELPAIEWVAHACEIVQCHHPDWKVKIADCIADNGLHGRLVVGTPVPIDQLPGLADRLPKLEVELMREGKVVDRGVGANVLDSPLLALEYLVEMLALQPKFAQLHAGEIVSTGTLTDAHPVAAGEIWSTRFTGLPIPGLTLRFE